ncbi:MAG: type I glyceraldehyde-3-phosphate dehydrogenase [Bacteroidetes bacterium]|nr:type I glyceraldehyde-3-phosphate dehydrogenase [Bacteroidota bacterium]
MRVGINGMGRIGRLLFRRIVLMKELEIVAINDIMGIDNLLYLLKFDSIYGTFPLKLSNDAENIYVGNKVVPYFQQSDPQLIQWKKLDADVVIECTGKFTNLNAASLHLNAGAKRVLLSSTGEDDITLDIFENKKNPDSSKVNILSPGGCMTNCSVPVLKTLQQIGIESAHINFLHSYTSRQELVDSPHKQFRRGRAAAESMIPVDIDLQFSLERLLPWLKNKITTSSTRVPVANGAMGNFYIQLSSAISKNEVNHIFKAASEKEYKGIIEFTDEEIVSNDVKGNTHSCVIDGTQTSVTGNLLRLVGWFDNEYGYTSRIIDWLSVWK